MRVYYDTSALEIATAARPSALLDPRRVRWTVIYSLELSAAEATIAEFLQELYVEYARLGVDVVEVTMAQIKAYMQGRAGLKQQLERLGMSSRDIKHLFAAASAKAALFVTRDADFFDPKNKSQGRSGATGKSVAVVVLNQLAIEVMRPKAAAARLLGDGRAQTS